MGRSTTSKYRVEFLTDNGAWTPQQWHCDAFGRPSAYRLFTFCKQQEQATQPGGVNAHVGATKILAARITTNTGEARLVCAYVASKADAAKRINWLTHAVSVPALGLDVAYGGE